MKTITFLISSLLLISCSPKKETLFISDLDKIEKIEVYKGFPQSQENKIEMQHNFEKEFTEQVKQAKKLGLMKFAKYYGIIIYKTDGKIDTLQTNGKIYQHRNKYFETKENLIDKYKK